jgi:hypothetical protein
MIDVGAWVNEWGRVSAWLVRREMREVLNTDGYVEDECLVQRGGLVELSVLCDIGLRL